MGRRARVSPSVFRIPRSAFIIHHSAFSIPSEGRLMRYEVLVLAADCAAGARGRFVAAAPPGHRWGRKEVGPEASPIFRLLKDVALADGELSALRQGRARMDPETKAVVSLPREEWTDFQDAERELRRSMAEALERMKGALNDEDRVVVLRRVAASELAAPDLNVEGRTGAAVEGRAR
jgi:hypothetical protein